MKLGVSLKIDVSKIDKSKLFKGQKGTYLDAQVFIDIDPDQYGNNGMITQAIEKAAREAGEQGAILGNAKIFWNNQGQQQQQQEWGQPQQPAQQSPQPQQRPTQQQAQRPQHQPIPGDGFDQNGVCLTCAGSNPDCPTCGIPF